MQWSFLILAGLAEVAFAFLSKAKWTNIGAVGTAGVGVLVFGDPLTGLRPFFLCTLIGSVLGLKAVSP